MNMRPFCKCRGKKHRDENWCSDPSMVISALEDAKDEMSYSNYHNEKFDVAIRAIRMLCREHKIPMKFVGKGAKICKPTKN